MNSDQSIAVILPMYNAASSIRRAIESVKKQTYTDWKLYVIDDCSTDNSIEIVQEYLSDNRIFILRNKVNSGVSFTRTKGINESSEGIVTFLDSDDEWSESKLEMQKKLLDQGHRLIFCDYFYHKDAEHCITYGKDSITYGEFLRKKYRVCFSSVCVDFRNREKEKFKKIGHEDFEYLCRLFKIFKIARIVGGPQVIYYCQENSLSSNKLKSARWHYAILKDDLGFGLVKRCVYFLFYVYQGLRFSYKFK